MESDPQPLPRYHAAIDALETAMSSAQSDWLDGTAEVKKAEQDLEAARAHLSDLKARRDDLAAAMAVLSAME